jgi:hypothetical protein
MRRDKGGTGIPKPAGAGGGSSSSSSEPFGGPTRLNNREITLGLRPLFAIPSAVRRAFIKRKERQNLVDLSDSAATEPAQRGAFSIARGVRNHDVRTALFSAVVEFGALVTSLG